MATTVFVFEKKLNIYYEEIQNQVLHNFPTITKAKQDGINIIPENLTTLSNYIAYPRNLKADFKIYVVLRIVFCLWKTCGMWKPATTTQLAEFGYDYERLFDEFIEFKNDTWKLSLKKKEKERSILSFGN